MHSQPVCPAAPQPSCPRCGVVGEGQVCLAQHCSQQVDRGITSKLQGSYGGSNTHWLSGHKAIPYFPTSNNARCCIPAPI